MPQLQSTTSTRRSPELPVTRFQEAVGQNTRLLKSNRQDPTFYRELWKTILSGEVWQGELINRRKGRNSLHGRDVDHTRARPKRGQRYPPLYRHYAGHNGIRRHERQHCSVPEKILEEVQSITPDGKLGTGRPRLVCIAGQPVSSVFSIGLPLRLRQPFRQILGCHTRRRS